ncbi:MAG: chemotaxis protein CheD [Magnetococcales bacterium]|nr:chemotaxis protein CheD [Magnetococcales bacterium]
MAKIPASGLPALDLQPGELHIATRPTVVTTILGSCVSLTLFHPSSRTGAICHGVMPRRDKGRERLSPPFPEVEDCFRFVDCAIRHMIGFFDRQGLGRSALTAKLFGGGDMFATSAGQISIGRQNVAVALQEVKDHALRLAASDVGGLTGRKIVFLTHTGQVFLKRLGQTDPNMIANLKFDAVPGWRGP